MACKGSSSKCSSKSSSKKPAAPKSMQQNVMLQMLKNKKVGK